MECENVSLIVSTGDISGISEVIQDLELSDDTSIDDILKEVERGNLEFLDKYLLKSSLEVK